MNNTEIIKHDIDDPIDVRCPFLNENETKCNKLLIKRISGYGEYQIKCERCGSIIKIYSAGVTLVIKIVEKNKTRYNNKQYDNYENKNRNKKYDIKDKELEKWMKNNRYDSTKF